MNSKTAAWPPASACALPRICMVIGVVCYLFVLRFQLHRHHHAFASMSECTSASTRICEHMCDHTCCAKIFASQPSKSAAHCASPGAIREPRQAEPAWYVHETVPTCILLASAQWLLQKRPVRRAQQARKCRLKTMSRREGQSPNDELPLGSVSGRVLCYP